MDYFFYELIFFFFLLFKLSKIHYFKLCYIYIEFGTVHLAMIK